MPTRIPGRLAAVAIPVLALVVGFAPAQRASASPVIEADEAGCTFRVPEPTVKNGRANLRVTVHCAHSKQRRRVAVALIADDPTYDDILRLTRRLVPSGRADHTIDGRQWNCDEDSFGHDEV